MRAARRHRWSVKRDVEVARKEVAAGRRECARDHLDRAVAAGILRSAPSAVVGQGDEVPVPPDPKVGEASGLGSVVPRISSRTKPNPWIGPLPRPRISPRRTLGDVFPAVLWAPDENSVSISGGRKISADRMVQISNVDAEFGLAGGSAGRDGCLSDWAIRFPGLSSLRSRIWRRPNPAWSGFVSGDRRAFVRDLRVCAMTGGGQSAGGGGGSKSRYGNGGGGGGSAPRGGGHGGKGSGGAAPGDRVGGRGVLSGRSRPARFFAPYGRGRSVFRWENRQCGEGRGRRVDVLAPQVHGAEENASLGQVRDDKVGREALLAADQSRNRCLEKHVDSNQSNKGKKSIILCYQICEEEHFTPQCPLLRAPKPSAIFCGFAGDGLGFFQIPHDGIAKAVKHDAATALIRVKEGFIPAELIQSELARLIPVKWQWVVEEHGIGEYIVPFPCHVELQRMVAIKEIRTCNAEGVMVFEEWNQKIEPCQFLQHVWVNVYGVPFEIRSFLPLWAVGSILGATQKVDMVYLRKTGVVRICVAVTDVNKIPDATDITVDDAVYEIFFKVDKVLPSAKTDGVSDGGLGNDGDTQQDVEDNLHGDRGYKTAKGMENQGSSSEALPEEKPSGDSAMQEKCLKHAAVSSPAFGSTEPLVHSVVGCGDLGGNLGVVIEMPVCWPSELLSDVGRRRDAQVLELREVGTAQALAEDPLQSSEDSVVQSSEDSVVQIAKKVLTACWPAELLVEIVGRGDAQALALRETGTVIPLKSVETAGWVDVSSDWCLPGCGLPENSSVLSPFGSSEVSGSQDAKKLLLQVSSSMVPVEKSVSLPVESLCNAAAPAIVRCPEPLSSLNHQDLVERGDHSYRANSSNAFSGLPRFVLQNLSKQNGIRANISNRGMAEALQALDSVVGIDMVSDLRNKSKVQTVSTQGVLNLAIIPGEDNSNRRTSRRTAALGDEHILAKAKILTAKRNLDDGTVQRHLLAKVLETTSQGGFEGRFSVGLSYVGGGGIGALRQAWMVL
ncbi:uncharacterized protein LOC133896950 [Phragmites australis]|uniref:uncharacterized protein LOC133896950 n=1 Tax=Phragmites australis TaxID=29695 RepID=UPI002D76B5BE|nr:uncharacterized protein LOC133896950 [Phragmites australis]